MNRLDFSAEERALLNAWQVRSQTTERLGFYATVLAPMAIFAVYGLLKRDVIAEFIAFFGLFLFLLWRLSAENSRARVYRSMMSKIIEHERTAASS
jgi:hypothetical protein